MMRFLRAAYCLAAVLGMVLARPAFAQDTTFRGVMISGAYDPLRDKIGITVLPISGAFGDSVQAIVGRDLDFSDRFTVISVDSAEPSGLRAQGGGAGLNYPLFARLSAAAVVQISTVPAGLPPSGSVGTVISAAPSLSMMRMLPPRMYATRVAAVPGWPVIQRWTSSDTRCTASRQSRLRPVAGNANSPTLMTCPRATSCSAT